MLKLFFTSFIGLMAWFGIQEVTSPDTSRFTKVVITEGLDEPMEMAFLSQNKVMIVERKGAVKIINEKTKEVSTAGFIKVNTKYTNKKGQVREAEEGLMGVSLDPNFNKNHWVYLYYAHPKESKHVLSRFELKDEQLVMESEKTMLDVVTQREECCHTGGGMTWDRAGNLFLTVGNNTVNPRQGSSNLVETPGLENEDDQRGPSNSNDLRGKILRIHPEPNGTYSIPKGNLFPVGTANARPEIYTMGHRNPWRPTLDSQTGFLYWGEVGPDASKDSTWGPKGYDEFNQAKAPGFFGWPYFIGNNIPYKKYNSADGTYGDIFDVNNPVNNSINNTGVKNLPKPTPAMLWYPYGPSKEFPLMGTSGRSATGGPVFRKNDFKNAPRPWPAYYEGKWLIAEFMRGWIMAITMDENGDYKSMERVLPEMNFSSAIDMDFGPSGDMYVLEYGSAWFRGNENSKLVKIEYNAGNRKPIVQGGVDYASGEVPLLVSFNADGTKDLDKDEKLTYTWKIQDANKKTIAMLVGQDPKFTFRNEGNFTAMLEVKDLKGLKNSISVPITVGNSAPQVGLELDLPNKTFYFGKEPIAYQVKVNDKEDGNSSDKIKAEEVAVTFDYIPQGFDPILMAANHKSADDLASFAVGKNLIEASDCKSCHQYNEKSIGPTYNEVAKKYSNTPENMTYLVKKIKEGGSGIWGEHGMSAHPDLSEVNAKRMVEYIFSMVDSKANIKNLPLSGTVLPAIPKYEREGSFVLRAAYKDKGTSKTKSLLSESILHLKLPFLKPQELDFSASTQLLTSPMYAFSLVGDKSYVGYKNIDLTNIKEIIANVQATARNGAIGGSIELRIGSPEGQLLGSSAHVSINEPTGNQRPPEGISAADWQRQRSGKAKIELKGNTKGKHDIYFVFRNEKAKSTDVLLQLVDFNFVL